MHSLFVAETNLSLIGLKLPQLMGSRAHIEAVSLLFNVKNTNDLKCNKNFDGLKFLTVKFCLFKPKMNSKTGESLKK